MSGAPGLAAEISVSSIPIDLNVKLPIYRRNGVREYLIWRVPDREIDWFVLRGTEYERLLLSPERIPQRSVPNADHDPAAARFAAT